MGSPRIQAGARKTKTVEWDGSEIEIVYRPTIGSKANIECLSASTTSKKGSMEVDAYRYLEERAKRQLVSIGGEEFNPKMLYEWPDEFGLIVLTSLEVPTDQLAKNLERLSKAGQPKTSKPTILRQPRQ